MLKAVTLCVFALAVVAPTVLSASDVCIAAQKLIWDKEITKSDQKFTTKDFSARIEVIRDQKQEGNSFIARLNNEQGLPQIELNGKTFGLQTIDIYPLDNTKKVGAVQLTFSHSSSDEPEEFVTFVTPLVKDHSKILDFKLQWDLYRMLKLENGDGYQANFRWLLGHLDNVAKIGSAPRTSVSNGKKNQVFLTACEVIQMWFFEAVVNGNPSGVTSTLSKKDESSYSTNHQHLAPKEWPECTRTKNLLWNEPTTTATPSFTLENFDGAVDIIRDTEAPGTVLTALPSSYGPLPKVTLEGTTYELLSINMYPLDKVGGQAAAQLTFVSSSSSGNPEEYISFVVPLLEDITDRSYSSSLWDFYRMPRLAKYEHYDARFKWFKNILDDATEIGKAPKDGGSNGKKHRVFLTDCNNVSMVSLRPVYLAELPKLDTQGYGSSTLKSPTSESSTPRKNSDPREAVSKWPQCAKTQRLIWDKQINSEDIISVRTENIQNEVKVSRALVGKEEQGFVVKSSQSPLPRVTVEDKTYELQGLEIYSLDNTATTAAIEVTFVSYGSSQTKEYVTFVVPLLSDSNAKPNWSLQWELYRMTGLGKNESYKANFKWLRPVLTEVVKIGKVSKNKEGRKHQTFLALCKSVKRPTLRPILKLNQSPRVLPKRQ